jgi:RNA polymerase sigma factor (sigma-70 family)
MSEALDDPGWLEVLLQLARAFGISIDLSGNQSEEDAGRAWIEVHHRMQMIARSYLRSRTLDSVTEDDVVQNAIVRFADPKILKSLREARYPAGYVVRLVRNQVIDRHRLEQRREISIPAVTKDSDLALEAQLRRLDDLLGGVNTEEWRLLYWRFFEQRKIADIAARLGESYSAVAKRLIRLLARLRADLEKKHR